MLRRRLILATVVFVVVGMAIDAWVLSLPFLSSPPPPDDEAKSLAVIVSPFLLLILMVWLMGLVVVAHGMKVLCLLTLRDGGIRVPLYDVQSFARIEYSRGSYFMLYDNRASYCVEGKVYCYETENRRKPLVEPAHALVHPQYPQVILGSDVLMSKGLYRILGTLLGIEIVMVGLSCLWNVWLALYVSDPMVLVLVPLVIPWFGIFLLCVTHVDGRRFQTLRAILLDSSPEVTGPEDIYEAAIEWTEADIDWDEFELQGPPCLSRF